MQFLGLFVTLEDLTVNVIPDSHLEKSKSKESLTDHHDHQMPRNLPDKSLKCLRLKQPPEALQSMRFLFAGCGCGRAKRSKEILFLQIVASKVV